MSYSLIGVSLVALAALIVVAWRRLCPTPYPGIPYNKESAGRIAGDIPDLVPVIQKTNEFSESVFTVTTQKLGTPIAQLLFPGIRNPLIILEDPREIEDVVFRRNREFDKAPMALDLFSPMFCRATLSQYTTPELKAQKRLWADVMSAEFLHRVAAPRIYKATLELLDLWRLKATTAYKGQAFHVMEDFQNAALDAIWVAVVGEEPGMTRHEMKKLRNQLSGDNTAGGNGDPPRGAFLMEEVTYISDTIGRNSNSPFPKWAQKLETWTPRYRRFRRTIASEVGRVMKTAVDQFQCAGNGRQEADELDTCMMDMVLRRQVVEANKAKRPMTDPTQDQSMLDEMFVFLFAGHDSTANVLSWFVKYMEAFPDVQTKLRSALRNAFATSQPGVKEILETDIPYLDATCEEGFRLAGVAKANLRSATVDTEILGYHVPKGAQIMMNYHINRSPVPVDESKRTSGARAAAVKFGDGLHSRAGHDIARFEPRRWLVKDKTTGREVFDSHAIPSLAFGGGYRGCTGRKLAYMEFRIVVTLLILNFEFQELPQEFKSMRGNEKILRKPDFPYAKLRAL
ncbi:Cytochrome P450 oxidoreductase [Apiospora rasikravindrae]|uniref:Cytochrome P450 oxidoreductase n=1 Tax=Apiospora rasikravindrae TaxID=990691 RepID=A0ABR1TYR3_9PEZI